MFERWRPRETYTKQEEFLLRRLRRTRKLFAFLRDVRRELFDDAFQAELESMYRNTGAGDEPVPPALMAMALIMQAYLGVSDAEAVELTVVDLRWQLGLDRLGSDEPAFGQGTIVAFRERLIAHDMDRRLLERTLEFARKTKAFDWKKLPKDLRIAIDSAPLEGAGRVEDTINLLGHAARNLVTCVAALLGWSFEKVARSAGIPVLLASSVKRGLDVEWSDPDAKVAAIKDLIEQVASLTRWLEKSLAAEIARPPLKEHVETLAQIVSQNLEPDPGGSGGSRIKEGVAPDRRVSIADPDMRHGRKSKSSGSTATSGTWPRISTPRSSWPVPSRRRIDPRKRPHRSSRPTSSGWNAASRRCTSTAPTSPVLWSASSSVRVARSCASPGFRATVSASPRPTSRSTCET